MRKYLSIFILLTSMLACGFLHAKGSADAEAVTELSVGHVDERGLPEPVFSYARGSEKFDLLFRAQVPDNFSHYKSWTFEVNDPSRNIVFRLSQDGPIPEVIHWDGYFDENQRIRKDGRYFAKIILELTGSQFVSSPWAVFRSKEKSSLEEGGRISTKALSLFIVPSGGMHVAVLYTKSFRTILYPNIFGDVKLIYKENHSLGLRMEATSNILFNTSQSATEFSYSNISFFYRLRLLGEPQRSPQLPIAPPYGTKKFQELPASDLTWGRPTNVEMGVRAFHTILRGRGKELIDAQLARNLQGLVGLLYIDHSLGALRAHIELEGGYSCFRGKALVGTTNFSITYDRFRSFAPGFQVRYTYMKGTAVGDEFTATSALASTFTNQLILGGVIVYFKI